MPPFPVEEWLPVLVGTSVVLLGLTAVVLAWEGYRRYRRQQQVRGELEKISGGGKQPEESTAGLIWEEPDSQLEWLNRVLLRLPHQKDLEHLLEQADTGWTPGIFFLLTLGAGAVTGLMSLVASGSWIVGLLAGVAGGSVPYLWLRRRRTKRIRDFEEHFPEAIDLLTRSIRAGHALNTGLQVIAEESPEPISTEFRQVFEEQRYGLPLRESLLGMADRIDLVDVRMFVTAILIQRESGGNLAENLENLGQLIRERFRFHRDIRTKTAHGRITGLVLVLAPIAAGMGLAMINPEYMAPLWEEQVGRYMIAGAAGLQILGFLAIRRIVDIEY